MFAQDKPEVLTVADTIPSFWYGNAAFIQFISDNMRYPALARKHGIEGKVFISFVIDTNGIVKDGKVLHDIGYGCGDEALRVVMQSHSIWKPAWNKGKKVPFRMNFPVTFSCNNCSKDSDSKILEVQPPPSSNQYYELGNRAMKAGHIKTAIFYYSNCLYYHKRDLDAAYNLGVALQMDGKNGYACDTWRKCLQLGDVAVNEMIDKHCGCPQDRLYEFGNQYEIHLPDDVDTLASYPGGEKAMEVFIQSHMKFPEKAKEKNYYGRQIIVLQIEKSGKISETYPAYPLLYGLPHEARRIVSMMPKWNPSYKNGKPVRSQVCIEINFR